MARSGLVLLAGIALLWPASTALAQTGGDRWQRDVARSMVRARGLAAERGYQPTGTELIGALFIDESESRTLSLAPGGHYLIIGVCDEDCRTLNLVLSNPNGDEIAVDRGEKNAPMVEAVAARGGIFRAKVIMGGCRVAPCRYGLAVYQRK